MRPSPSADLTAMTLSLPQALRCPPPIPTWLYQAVSEQLQEDWEDQESGQKASGHTSPPSSLEARTASPSPAPSVALGPPLHQRHQQQDGSPRGSQLPPPGVSNTRSSSHAGKPESVSPATPSGHSQKQQGVAGRIQNFIVKHFCCRLPSKECHSKVSPCKLHG